MGVDAGSIAFASAFTFVGSIVVVLALMGFHAEDKPAHVMAKFGRKKREAAVPAQRRASRPRKRDRAKQLPAM